MMELGMAVGTYAMVVWANYMVISRNRHAGSELMISFRERWFLAMMVFEGDIQNVQCEN